MAAIRQCLGVTGLIFLAVSALSYWKLIHIGPALENSAMICLGMTVLALTVVEQVMAKKT
jgi:hypothetical protein